MNSHRIEPVASGVPYLIHSVNDHEPGALADFGPGLLGIIASFGGQTITIHGTARVDGDRAIIFEKDDHGTGRDLRTWDVHRHDDRFHAWERSNY